MTFEEEVRGCVVPTLSQKTLWADRIKELEEKLKKANITIAKTRHGNEQYTKILDFCINQQHWKKYKGDNPVLDYIMSVPKLEQERDQAYKAGQQAGMEKAAEIADGYDEAPAWEVAGVIRAEVEKDDE